MLLQYTVKSDFITSWATVGCKLLWNVRIPGKRGVTFKMAANLTLTTVKNSTPRFMLIKFIIIQTLFDWNVILQYLPKPYASPLSPKFSTVETMLRDFNLLPHTSGSRNPVSPYHTSMVVVYLPTGSLSLAATRPQAPLRKNQISSTHEWHLLSVKMWLTSLR